MRVALLAGVLVAVAGAVTAGSQAPVTIDALLAQYTRGDFQAIERAITSEQQYEALRRDLGWVDKHGQVFGVMARWHNARQPAHAVFMLEFALAGLNRRYEYWLDVLEQARRFLAVRQSPPGRDPEEDAFEIAWHKTSIALLFGQHPDFVRDHGLTPLAARVAASPVDGEARLVDPWFALARGMLEEQAILIDPASRAVRGPVALAHFEEAAAHASTRAEALVRMSRVLLDLGRPEDAVAASDRLRPHLDTIGDTDVAYWHWLLRGRALARLGRLDRAARAFEEARRTVPGAQAPAVALLALELRRDEPAKVLAWAEAARRTPEDVADPWWHYEYADFRFFRSRTIELRRMMLR
jgi:tetratricopeptide (TPR) repeat protein